MTEVPGTDRDKAREEVLHEVPLVPESVDDTDDDPRTSEHPVNRGDAGETGDEAKPPPGDLDFGTD